LDIPDQINSLQHIWQIRWTHILYVLSQEISVIASDVDVVWKKRPMILLPFDILASQGTFPDQFYHKWGFTVCTGLLFLSGNERVTSLISLVLDDLNNTKDDQMSLNVILDQSKLELFRQGEHSFYFTLFPFLRIGLLSKDEYNRDCTSMNPIAFHCLTSKKANSKIKYLKSKGLFKVV